MKHTTQILIAVIPALIASMSTYVAVTSSNFLMLPIHNKRAVVENTKSINSIKYVCKTRDSILFNEIVVNRDDRINVVEAIKSELDQFSDEQRKETAKISDKLSDVIGFLKARENYYGLAGGNDSTAAIAGNN